MKALDTLYEAYQNYKKLCITDHDTSRFFLAYMNIKDRDSEDLVSIFSVCHIEQDWVDAIEKGLPFFEKAIKEERQFIRNDGEVLPIEKIRKTSKDSIQDLAKHANYITHEAPDNLETEVLPDKMLMIQKESDFAIYENRVLYAALMYLKDFVASRLVEIKETTNTYLVKQHIKKIIDMGSRKIHIDLDYDESRVNDPLLTDKNHEKDVIDRLDEILTGILALLKTPLMREVSKAEMVSRPIAKTNILKMNRNFRESLACFEYIANYQGKGFTIEHVEKSLIPYTKAMNESYTELLIMLSFLNYMYANNISQQLKEDLEAIYAEREKQKNNELLAKLRNFHATAETKEQTMNEFLIAFEQGYRILEERNDELELEHKESEIRREKELADIEEKHLDEIDEINEQNAQKIKEAERDFNQRLTEYKNQMEDELRQGKENAALELEEYKEQFRDHIKQMEAENAAIKAKEAAQIEKIASLEAQLLNNSIKNGDAKAIDFNSEEAFDQLEQLKKDFDAFYEKAWKEAKKQIRRDILFARKNKKKKDEEPEAEPGPVRPAPAPAPAPQPEPEPEPEPIKEEPIPEEPVQEEAPVEEAPIEEPVQEEAPVEEAPIEEPVEEQPIEEEPQAEEPIEEAPVEEETQEEASIEEPQIEEQPEEVSEPEQPVEEEPEQDEEPAPEEAPLEEQESDVPNEEEPVQEEETSEPIEEEKKEDAIE